MYSATEIEAAVDFQVQFLDEYGDDHVDFLTCSLETAIAETCHVPIDSRRILGLYFHNKSDPFTKIFCSSIQNKEIRKILEKSFYFLGWNVAEQLFHNPLVEVLKTNLATFLLESLVIKRQAAFVIIVPIENQTCIFALLHGSSVKQKDILASLKEAESCFCHQNSSELELQKLTNVEHTNNQLGSIQFQQMMNDQLGDRDYDKFECDQHEALQQKIGFAKFGPPISENGYNEKQQKVIKTSYNQIRKYNNQYSEYQDQIVISVVYSCLEPLPDVKLSRAKKYSDYNPLTDLLPVPVFVIRKCLYGAPSCRLFIDNDDRVYNSWEDYIKYNKHSKCFMIVPKDGRYTEDENGCPMLEKHLSPACSIIAKLLTATDIGASVVGIGSLLVIGASLIPAITVAPIALTACSVTGFGIGVYSVIRSALGVYDRRRYGESMSFMNSEARGAYLNIVAGSLGFVGAGATAALSHFVMEGVIVTKGMQYAVNTINVMNLTASGVSFGNSTYQVIDDWIVEQQTPSALTVIQLTSSLLFFGNATYNFQSAASIINEVQVNTMKQYENSLKQQT